MIGRRTASLVALLVVFALALSACSPAAAPAQTAKPAATTPDAAAPAAKAGTPNPTPKAAGEAPKSGGVLTVNTSYPDPQDLDLVPDHTVATEAIIRPAYSGLLQYDPLDQTKIMPDLAERWEMTPDGKLYTVYLRKGVEWHDGKPFSSEDVKYTLDRMVDPNDPEKVRLMTKREAMQGIDKIEAPDAGTVKITLKQPRGSFAPWLAWGSLVIGPKHIPISGLSNTAVGTGAYKFKSFACGSSLELVKNPDYFVKDRPYLNGITFYIIRDVTTTLAAFKTKRLHLARNILPSKAKEVKEGLPGATLQVSDMLTFGYFGMNAAKPPFNDIRVRRAAFLAIDRQAAIDVLAEGYGKTGTVIPPGEWARPIDDIMKLRGYRQPKDADMTEAKKLMADAGYPSGFKTAMLTASRADYERAAVFLKDQLSKIGIDASLDMKEFALYMRERTATNFAVSTAGPGATYIPDPAGHRKYYGRENFVGLKDERIFDLIDQQDATTNPAERKKMLWEMDDRLMDQAAIVVLYWGNMVSAIWPEVKDFTGGSQFNNHAYIDVWLAK